MRIGVVGHVEHVTIARVPALPAPGEIVHLDQPEWLPGGGGGITFAQLTKSPAEVHLFTALGNDEAAGEAERTVQAAIDASIDELFACDEVSVFIGPEGGFEPAEVERAKEHGALVVTMGERVMRSETAGLVAAALVLHAVGELG